MQEKEKEVRLIPFTVNSLSTDPYLIPEGVDMIGAKTFWDQGYKGEGIVIAVLDTGCEKNHPELKNRIIGGRNFTNDHYGNLNTYEDNNGHGTHVCGTICADGSNGGIIGVAPFAKLLIGKVLDGQGSGSYASIIRGIEYAINWRGSNGERVRIINMSLGGADDVPELHEAIKKAVDNNICVVVAAGNEGDDLEDTFEFAYPAAYNEVIEVGAIDFNKQLAYFSNNNTEIDCVSTGVNILSTYPMSVYARLSGTSMASPHVAGALALLIQKEEKEFQRPLSEAEIYARLIKHTESLGFRKSSEGNGMVNLDVIERYNKISEFIKGYCK